MGMLQRGIKWHESKEQYRVDYLGTWAAIQIVSISPKTWYTT